MNIADPARVKPMQRRCPDGCPWGTHPENPSWQRCGVYDCQIERPAPGVRVAEAVGNGALAGEQGEVGHREGWAVERPAERENGEGAA